MKDSVTKAFDQIAQNSINKVDFGALIYKWPPLFGLKPAQKWWLIFLWPLAKFADLFLARATLVYEVTLLDWLFQNKYLNIPTIILAFLSYFVIYFWNHIL